MKRVTFDDDFDVDLDEDDLAPVRSQHLRAPFPWFGGKRRESARVWQALGDVDSYIEPFAGSLAVLLARPAHHRGRVEVVNDLDAYLTNFWRAVQADPGAVVQHAYGPVHELDLMARHRWLVKQSSKRIEKMKTDPEYYDAKVAGWWVWGLSAWIGSGWCSGKLGKSKLPAMGSGSGVHRQKYYGADGQPSRKVLLKYITLLSRRLRRVRVCTGSWERVVTKGVLSYGERIGVFLDPPYANVNSDKIYSNAPTDDVSAAVREWCVEHGDDRRLRIVLCGYVDEHELPDGWTMHQYSAGTSYQSSKSAKRGDGNAANRHKECFWFSPGCVSLGGGKFSLLAGDSVV